MIPRSFSGPSWIGAMQSNLSGPAPKPWMGQVGDTARQALRVARFRGASAELGDMAYDAILRNLAVEPEIKPGAARVSR